MIGLAVGRRVGADGVGSGGDDNRIAFAGILVEVEIGGHVFQAVRRRIARRLS